MTMFNAKGSGLSRMNFYSLPLKRHFMEGKWCCVYGVRSLQYYSFWVFKLWSNIMQTYTLNRFNVCIKIKEIDPHSSIGETLCYSVITQGKNHTRKNIEFRLVCSTPSIIFSRLFYSLLTVLNVKKFSQDQVENFLSSKPTEFDSRNQQTSW